MHLANPEYLYLLILVPLYLLWLYYDKKNKQAIKISVFEDLKIASQNNYIRKFVFLRKVLVIILIILWIFVLVRPQGAHEKQEIGKKGIDMIIAIDVSGSMLAEDLKPNRIEAAKEALEKFIDKLETDRLGVIVFSGQAFTQSPLTFDYNILEEYIKNISTDTINSNIRGLSGTAIGDAILSGVNRFKDSIGRSKVLIVITDGDANTGVDPEIAAKKAKELGIKIYTVGVGKQGGAPLPITDRFGRKTIAKDRDGTPILATFNEDSLKKIAKIADGKYFRAGDSESFNRIMEEIGSLEKKDIKMKITTEYTENFMPYLISLILIFIFYLYLLAYKTEIK